MGKQKFRLMVVIINYKTPQLVCDALTSLSQQIDTALDKVVIVDNASQDNSVNEITAFLKLKRWDTWASVIPSSLNGGFSAGNNIGIRSDDAEYYLLLNSDAFVRENAIKLLLTTAETDSSIGIIGPRLEWPDGSQQVSCFYDLSPTNSFLHSVKIGSFTKIFRIFNIREVAIPLEEHNTVQPDWLSFACVLLRCDMIRDVGFMDEGYFMYREDNDYCRRAINAGWGLKFEAKARVVHLNKGSSNQMGLKRLPKYYFKSRTRYFLKFYGRLGLLQANIFWCLGRGISSVRELIAQKPKAFHSRMWLDIWTGFLTKQGQNEK